MQAQDNPSPTVWASLGGGLDSWAMLLDQVARGNKPHGAIFADVADPEHLDPGEWPGTYKYLREIIAPWCREQGIEFVWLSTKQSPIRGERSLFAYFERTSSMPSRMSRLCTSAAKVERIQRYLGDRYPDRLIEMWIGFGAGEEARALKDPHSKGRDNKRRINRFPLIERGLCRCRSEALVRRRGFPVPRKSACTFCPFSSRGDFKTLRDQLPQTFARVEALEEDCKRTRSGKVMRYGYEKGDGTDLALSEWIDYRTAANKSRRKLSLYAPREMDCPVCGAKRATKATACDWLDGNEERRAS